MIEISVNKAHAHAKKIELLTTGMSKAVDVEFAFSKDWDALKKTAVFTNGTTTRDVLLKSETSICSVPPEVLTVEGASVMCGVYGHNADGIIIPTIYVWLGNVNPGTDPSGDESVAPSLPVYEQLRTMIETHVKSIDNPHGVTAEQVGAYTKYEVDEKLGFYLSHTTASDLWEHKYDVESNQHKVTAEQVGSLTNEQTNQIINSALSSHKSEINPHKVTAEQVGAYTKEDTDSRVFGISSECANAIKGYITGETVFVDDISPVMHKVKAKVYSKNIANANNVIKSTYASMSYSEPQLSISRFNKEGKYANIYIYLGEYAEFVGKTLTCSIKNCEDVKAWQMSLRGFSDSDTIVGPEIGVTQIYASSTSSFTASVPVIDGAKRLVVRLASISGTATEKVYVLQNFQVEIGDTVTEYKPFIVPATVTVTRYGSDETDNPQTYVPDEHGKLDIESLFPTMTLLTDTAGVIIDAEYNKDTNDVIDDINNELDTLSESLGDIDTALDELHAYAQALVSGGVSE